MTAGTINIFGKFAGNSTAIVTINGANINIDPKLLPGSDNVFAFSTNAGTNPLTFTSGIVTILNPVIEQNVAGKDLSITSSIPGNISGTATFVFGQGASTVASA